MWVFDVDAEAELLQDASLRFDHVTLAADIHLIQQQGADEPDGDSAASEHTPDSRCTAERRRCAKS